MDLQAEELSSLSAAGVVREALTIPRAARRDFAMVVLALVFPLSFAILAHTLFTHPILLHLQSPSASASEWSLLLLYQFSYLIFLFVLSLLATAVVVFIVASLYADRPTSFVSALSALPPILPRLLRTFLFVALIMTLYHLAFGLSVLPFLLATSPDAPMSLPAVLAVFLIVLAFLAVHVYISAIWHLASVISVLEPVYGFAAMVKSRELLRGRTRMAAALASVYLGTCGIIGYLFRAVVVKGPGEDGSFGVQSAAAKVIIGGALVAMLVAVNFVGLLVQSVFYYVCKSYHHQQIDKSALSEHLGGYLGEYVPLKSSIQMENL